LKHAERKPANIGLRSQYSLRLYSWAKKQVSVGKKRISLEELRKVFGLESVKDAHGNVLKDAPLPVWANLRQRALNLAVAEINGKDRPKRSDRVAGAITSSKGNGTYVCD
jgi:hypothetical protein